MKKAILTTSLAFILVLVTVVSCKKTESTPDETGLQTTVSVNSTDQTNIQNDDDAIANDATAAAETTPSFDGGTVGTVSDSTTIQGAVIDKSALKPGLRRMIIRYHRGLLFAGIRSGKVTIELVKGTRWTDSGAILKETFDSIKIGYGTKTRLYQGVRYVTNVSGGYFGSSVVVNPFIYTVRAVGSVTFEDNTVRTFWAARKNTFNKLTYTFTSDGDSTVNGKLCSMGGTSRFGQSFLVKAPQTYVASRDCNYFRSPSAGIRIYSSDNRDVTITFGVDVSGTQVTSGCASYFKVNWVKLNGQTGVAVIAY